EEVFDARHAGRVADDAAPGDRVTAQLQVAPHFRRASATATTMIPPRTISCWLDSSPARMRPLLMSPIITDPSSEPITLARPPNRLVPPRMTAAITESSSPSPHWKRPDCSRPAYSIPAIPAVMPIAARTRNVTSRVLTPLKRAAIALPPVARTRRPYDVLRRTTWPITTATSVQTTSDGTGPRSPDPKALL